MRSPVRSAPADASVNVRTSYGFGMTIGSGLKKDATNRLMATLFVRPANACLSLSARSNPEGRREYEP